MLKSDGKILWFATHPIQYQTPLIKEMDITVPTEAVFFADDFSGKKFQSKDGFAKNHSWGVDVLDGLKHHVLRAKVKSTKSFFGIVANWKELFQLLREEEVKVVIINGWFPFCYLQVWIVCRCLGIPFIVRGDSNLLMNANSIKKWIKKQLLFFLLKLPSSFAYVGERTREFFIYHKVPNSKLFPGFHTVKKPQGRKQEKLIAGLQIGFLGKHIPKKNLEWLIEGLMNWERKDWKLIVGGDGPLTRNLKDRFKDSRIVWEGFIPQSELAQFYNKLDVFVLPSAYNETWGLVINEAMECGVPCLVSNQVGCAVDLIDQGKTGFVFDLDSYSGLYQGLGEFQKIPNLEKMVLEKIKPFSIQNVAQQMLDGITKRY